MKEFKFKKYPINKLIFRLSKYIKILRYYSFFIYLDSISQNTPNKGIPSIIPKIPNKLENTITATIIFNDDNPIELPTTIG